MSEQEPLLCPSCGSRHLRISRRARLLTRIKGFFTRKLPYRCRDCRAELWLTWREHKAIQPPRRNGAWRRLTIRLANFRGRDLRCPVCESHGPRRERAYKLHQKVWSRSRRLLVWECHYCRTTFMGQKVGEYEPEV